MAAASGTQAVTGFIVFLLLLLIVMQSKLLQELLGIVMLGLVAAVAYGYYISATTPPAEQPASPVAIQPAPEVQVPKDPARPPATSPAPYNFDPWQGPRQPRPYRQQ
jgi:hypothetical protein